MVPKIEVKSNCRYGICKHLPDLSRSLLKLRRRVLFQLILITLSYVGHTVANLALVTGWLKKVSCCTVIDISMARQ